MENYTINEHTHRYAVWAAARAASVGRLSNQEVNTIFETINLKAKTEDLMNVCSITDIDYNNWIKTIGDEIMNEVKKTKFKITKKENFKNDRVSFGIAAKLISIYIKTVVVIPTQGNSLLAAIAYPPIDSILLKNINSKHKLNMKHQWSNFDWDNYNQTIQKLKTLFPGVPMWKIESYWNV